LEHIRELTALEHLNLSGTLITDTALQRLADMGRLRELRLVGTATTEAGAADLKESLPIVRIYR
jgi:hypothetical protein